ncbi:MAG: hypothetical protein M1824_001252 [Vezdaea acicularis]|nr:MAG: hypothetical protein M1824_001252 [Vezdaea acicularis]
MTQPTATTVLSTVSRAGFPASSGQQQPWKKFITPSTSTNAEMTVACPLKTRGFERLGGY